MLGRALPDDAPDNVVVIVVIMVIVIMVMVMTTLPFQG